jgi:hypothetical protein
MSSTEHPDKQTLWDQIAENFYSTLERKKFPQPYDIHVYITTPTLGKKGTKYRIDMTSFFLRYPEATFHNVVFAVPKGRREAGDKFSIEDPVAIFDTELPNFTKKSKMDILKTRDGDDIRVCSSKAHAIQLFYMFKREMPIGNGKVVDLFLKLTPLIPGEKRESKKVCRITDFSPIAKKKPVKKKKVAKKFPIKKKEGN